MNEIWKDIVGYEGLYQVSNLGNVKSLDRVIIRNNNFPLTLKGKMMKLQIYKPKSSPFERIRIQLSKNGQVKDYIVARLVAMAFIPNPNNLPQVNHKDENPLNNCVENLEWCTNEYNHNYGTRNERQAQKLFKPVSSFDMNGNFLKTFESIKAAAKYYKLDDSSIAKVCKNINKYCGNYIFRYA